MKVALQTYSSCTGLEANVNIGIYMYFYVHILKHCWKQMATGSNPPRSPGNLYSAYPNPVKILSCFRARMHLSFGSPPLGLK